MIRNATDSSFDFLETLSDGTQIKWDAWGPSPSGHIPDTIDGFTGALDSLERHFIVPDKGCPIIDLAGLPESKAKIVREAAAQLHAQTGKAYEILEETIR